MLLLDAATRRSLDILEGPRGASLLAASFDSLLMGPIEVNYPPDVICANSRS